MDGTYGNPIARSQSPMSPATPSTPAGQYQVNISRKKTRKWVEAKAQSYDGGGWGDDDDESSEEQEPVPPVPQAAAAHSSRLPSESRGPFAPPPHSVASETTRAASPLSLNAEPRQPIAAGAGDPAFPIHTSNAPDAFSRGTSTQAQDAAHLERSGTNNSGYTQPRPTFDNYDANNGQGTQGYSLQDPGKPSPAYPAAGLNDEPALGEASDINRAESSSSPQLPNVLRTSVFGADMFSSSFSKPAEVAEQQERQPSPSGQTPAGAASTPPNERPTEPTTSTVPDAEAKQGTSAQRPHLPGEWVTETPSIPDAGLSEEKRSEDGSDSKPTASAAGNGDQITRSVTNETITASDGHRPGQHALPPLQTGTPPQDPQSSASVSAFNGPPIEDAAQRQSRDSTSSPRSEATDIPPTQPLQPRKPDFSPADYDLQPIHRQVTQSTVTSSPMKESDMLRDEIMRTLSPAKEDFPDNKPPWPARQDTQESSYSLGGYDAYWAEASASRTSSDAKKPDASTSESAPAPIESAPAPSVAPTEAQGVDATPLNAQNETKGLAPEPASESRQRFSWEMGQPPPVEQQANTTDLSVEAKPAAPPADPIVQSPVSERSDSTARDAQSARQVTSPEISSPGSPPVLPGPTSPQGPGLNASLAANDKTALPEPPSPVSAMSEQQASSGRNSVPGEQPPTVTSTTPPPAASIAPASPTAPTGAHGSQVPQQQQQQPQIMAFRDIMGMPTAAERIERYDQTRGVFATMDSGLEDWMTNLKAQHPEHADQTSSFYGAGIQAQGSALSVGTAPGAQTSQQQQQQQQQPYYQQYLNASSPAVNPPAAGRSRIGTLPMQLQGATSTFGSSSNQIGTKGKEFMQSAGKMGKGLFNKGKSKLRGTGDKESKKAPPAGQPKSKHERRTSWGLSLGGRVRTGSPGPQSGQRNVSATTMTTRTETSPPPPQVRQAATAATWSHRPSHDFPGRQTPALHDRTNSNNMSPGVIRGERMGMNDPNRDPTRAGAWQPVSIGRPSMDQVSVDSDLQAGQSNRAFTPEPVSSKAPPRPPFAAIPEDSGVALPPSGSESTTPKRNSFVGLPPIRRNSTLSSLDFLGGGNPELHSFLKLDDDDTPADTPREPSTADNAPAGLPLNGSIKEDVEAPEQERLAGQVEKKPVSLEEHGPVVGPVAGPESASVQERDFGDDQEDKSLSDQVKPLHHEQATEPQQPRAGPSVNEHRQWEERTVPSPPPIQESRLPPPPSQESRLPPPPSQENRLPTNPMQQFPAGTWKLEESYLVEPLNSVTRNRSGSGIGSPQPPSDGFEKETGLGGGNTSGTDELLPLMVPGRSRTADVPPSSARRYPDLFPPRSENGAPRGPAPLQKATQHDYHRYMITQSRSGRPNGSSSQDADDSAAKEEQAPTNRGPGGLRSPGQRIVQGTPTDGRNATPEPRPETPDLRGDEVSEASVNLDGRKKKRSSFLPGLRNANSTDVSLPLSREVTNNRAQTPDSFVASESAEPHSERKRSLFSSAAGAITGKSPLKFAQSANSRSAQGNQPTQGNSEASTSKTRLAGLKMTNLASKFNRAAQGKVHKQGSPQLITIVGAATQAAENKPQTNPPPQPAAPETSAPPDSPGSPVFPSHPAVGETSQARHKRQASAIASGQDPDSPGHRPASRPQPKDEPTPRKISGGSLSPTHNPAASGASGASYPGAPLHGPPQQPLPSIPAAPGSSRGASLEGGRPSNQFENPRASPRAPDFSAAQKSPPVGGTLARSSMDKPSPSKQARHAHERQSSGQFNRQGGPRSPPFVQTRNAQAQQPGADAADRARAMATSPEPPPKDDIADRQTPSKGRPLASEQGSGRQTPSKGRPSGTEHIALVQQSPKPSIDLPGSSNQQSGSQWQQGGPVRPVDNAQGAGRGGQSGAQGSLWKGLKSRMSDQISHAAPRGQGKAGNASSKLLGAIKRGPTEQTTPTQPPGQSQPLSQWRPTQTASQQQSAPPGQPQSQPITVKLGPQQPTQQGQPLVGRPGGPQAKPRQQRSGEPQYDQVPIPQGYHTVRGEGRIAPSPYIGQHVQQPHQFHQQQQQQMAPQGYQPQQQWPQTGAAAHDQNPSSPGQHRGPQGPNAIAQSERRLSGFQGANYAAGQQGQPPQAGNTVNGRQMGRPGFVQDTTQNGHVGGGAHFHQGHQLQQQRSHLNTSPSMSEESSLDRRPSQVSQASTQTAASNTVVNGHAPKAANPGHLGIDVQKAQQDREVDLYDATPKATTAPTGASSTTAAANVELEDTEEARKRTLRLESQEDKILADPEEEAPQMSATSYPGQMWNPYGMEFVDWRDD